jgi:hypothetical protein
VAPNFVFSNENDPAALDRIKATRSSNTSRWHRCSASPFKKADADPVLVARCVALRARSGGLCTRHARAPEILPTMGGGVGRTHEHWAGEFAVVVLEAHLFLACGILYIRAAAIPADKVGVIGLGHGRSR